MKEERYVDENLRPSEDMNFERLHQITLKAKINQDRDGNLSTELSQQLTHPLRLTSEEEDNVKAALLHGLIENLNDDKAKFLDWIGKDREIVIIIHGNKGVVSNIIDLEKGVIALSWRAIRAPPEFNHSVWFKLYGSAYQDDLALSLKIILYHELRRLISPQDSESTNQQYTIENLKKHSDIFNAHQKILGLKIKKYLTEDEKYFLLADEDLRNLIRQKLDYAVIRSDTPSLDFNTDKAVAYFELPENKYAFDRVMTSAGPGAPGGQTGAVIEFLVNTRGCIIPMMSRYRAPLSFRIDGISEIRPESAAFVPVIAMRLSRPNVSTINFPLYCADKRMGRVPDNEWTAGIGWTWCTQPWADEVGMLYEYGKLATKEEYEALIVSALERAAEDAVGGASKVKNLGDTLYDDNYLGGEGRGLELIGAKGPNEKYAMDYFELVQDYFANRVFVDPLVPYNIKLTHVVLAFVFYGLKGIVYLNFLFFFLGVVVGGFDLTAGFVFVAFFLGYLLLTSQSINRSIILLYNRLYGLHHGFFIGSTGLLFIRAPYGILLIIFIVIN